MQNIFETEYIETNETRALYMWRIFFPKFL